MARIKHKSVSPDEQTVLDRLQVRPLTGAEDLARCDELIVQEHYLHDATLVGEQLRYVATFQGQWLAVATWSAAALHLKARDQFIGWTPEQCRRRRPLLANNSRLLVLEGCHYPNLISSSCWRACPRIGRRTGAIPWRWWKASWIRNASRAPPTKSVVGRSWDAPPAGSAMPPISI